MLFEVRRRSEDGVDVVSVVGDVDLATMPRLVEAVSAATGELVIDLSGVDWFDPVCSGVLVAADLRGRRSGSPVTVVASPAVTSLLAETQLDLVLTVRTAG